MAYIQTERQAERHIDRYIEKEINRQCDRDSDIIRWIAFIRSIESLIAVS